MTPEQIPAALVEAAARAVHEHDRLSPPFVEPAWDDITEPERESYRSAERVALAAALGLCEVREEGGCLQVRTDTGQRYTAWDGDQPGSCRSAQTHWDAGPRSGVWTSALVRRYTINTPAEPAEPNAADDDLWVTTAWSNSKEAM